MDDERDVEELLLEIAELKHCLREILIYNSSPKTYPKHKPNPYLLAQRLLKENTGFTH